MTFTHLYYAIQSRNRTAPHTAVIPENIDPGRPGFAADNIQGAF